MTEIDNFLADFGGRRIVLDDPTDLLYHRTLHTVRGRMRSFSDWQNISGQLLIFDAGIARRKDMNACSGREKDVHCVAIFEPLIGAFFDFYTSLLSLPSFLPNIGQPTRESPTRLKEREATLGFGYIAAAGDGTDPLERMTLPRCPERAQIALHMAHIAYDFVWSHELWHAAMGHVGFAETLNVRAMTELPDNSSDLRLMPLEVEADQLATYWVVDQAFQPATPYLASIFKFSPIERLFIIRLAFVLAAFFWAHLQRVETETEGQDPYAVGSHPAPLLRLHLALLESRKYLAVRRAVPSAALDHLDILLAKQLDSLAITNDWFTILASDVVFSRTTIDSITATRHAISMAQKEISPTVAAYQFRGPKE